MNLDVHNYNFVKNENSERLLGKSGYTLEMQEERHTLRILLREGGDLSVCLPHIRTYVRYDTSTLTKGRVCLGDGGSAT